MGLNKNISENLAVTQHRRRFLVCDLHLTCNLCLNTCPRPPRCQGLHDLLPAVVAGGAYQIGTCRLNLVCLELAVVDPLLNIRHGPGPAARATARASSPWGSISTISGPH